MKRASSSCCIFLCVVLAATWSIADIACHACHSSGTFFSLWHTDTHTDTDTHTQTQTHTDTHTHTHTHTHTRHHHSGSITLLRKLPKITCLELSVTLNPHHHIPIFSAAKCKLPNLKSSTTMTGLWGSRLTGAIFRIQISCKTGFFMTGSATNSVILKCRENGTWSKPVPTCESM